LIVEILSAVLSGHYDAAAGDGPAGGTQAEPRFAQCFIAIDVERLLGPDRFRADMDRLVGVLESVRPAAGFDAVRVPGSRADAEERQRRAEGVPLRDEDWELVRSTWAAHGFGPLA
jgi:LDH2 family malate/lactate/ureidoglycolate dehydrogenase